MKILLQEKFLLVIAALTIWLGTFSCNFNSKKFSKTYEQDSLEVKSLVLAHFKNNVASYLHEHDRCLNEAFLSRHLYDIGFEYDTIIGGFSIKHFRTLTQSYSFCLVWDQQEYFVVGKYVSEFRPGTESSLESYFKIKEGNEIGIKENTGPGLLNDLNLFLQYGPQKNVRKENKLLFDNLILFLNAEVDISSREKKLESYFVKLDFNDESLKMLLDRRLEQVSLDFVSEINSKYSIFAYIDVPFKPGTSISSLDALNASLKYGVPPEDNVIGLVFYEYSPEIKSTYIPLNSEVLDVLDDGVSYRSQYPECY